MAKRQVGNRQRIETVLAAASAGAGTMLDALLAQLDAFDLPRATWQHTPIGPGWEAFACVRLAAQYRRFVRSNTAAEIRAAGHLELNIDTVRSTLRRYGLAGRVQSARGHSEKRCDIALDNAEHTPRQEQDA